MEQKEGFNELSFYRKLSVNRVLGGGVVKRTFICRRGTIFRNVSSICKRIYNF